jgi:hypothetical protein
MCRLLLVPTPPIGPQTFAMYIVLPMDLYLDFSSDVPSVALFRDTSSSLRRFRAAYLLYMLSSIPEQNIWH